MPTANDLRKGNVIRYNGEPQLIMDLMHRKPGKGHAVVQAKMRNLRTGRSGEYRFTSTETVEFLETDSKDMEFSYRHMDVYSFMDLETYETLELSETVVGEAKQYLTEGCKVTVLYVDGAPVEIEPPNVVELVVTEAPEAVKSDATMGATKSVILETGIRVSTPLFIKNGDKIRISTADGSYQGRA